MIQSTQSIIENSFRRTLATGMYEAADKMGLELPFQKEGSSLHSNDLALASHDDGCIAVTAVKGKDGSEPLELFAYVDVHAKSVARVLPPGYYRIKQESSDKDTVVHWVNSSGETVLTAPITFEDVSPAPEPNKFELHVSYRHDINYLSEEKEFKRECKLFCVTAYY